MKATDRTALIFGLSAAGAFGFAWMKGYREPQELLKTTAVHAVMIGGAVYFVSWLADDHEVALNNRGQKSCPPTGQITSEGVKLLSTLNPGILYKAAKMVGIQIGPEGDNPMHVQLPRE